MSRLPVFPPILPFQTAVPVPPRISISSVALSAVYCTFCHRTDKMCSMSHIVDTIEIGKTIAQKRRELRLTQQELADRAGVSRRTLIELEHGRNDISLRRMLRILLSLGLQLDVRPASGRPTEDQLREIFSDDD